MTLKRPTDGADEIDPDATVELEVPDFSDTAAVQALDGTVSLPALITADLHATTDTYVGLGHVDVVDHFANKLQEVEERLRSQTDRLAELELECESRKAAEQQLRESTQADLETARQAAAQEVDIAREQARRAVQDLQGALLLASQESGERATQLQALQARVLTVEAEYSALLGSHLQLAQQEGQQANLAREVAALRAANESQLEALRSVEGYRNVSGSLLDEREGQIAELERGLALQEQARLAREQQFLADLAAREAQWAGEKAQEEQEVARLRREAKAAEKRAQKQAYELTKQHDAERAELERQLAQRIVERETQVGELTVTLERQLAELRQESQVLAMGHATQLAALATAHEERLAAAVAVATGTAATASAAQRSDYERQLADVTSQRDQQVADLAAALERQGAEHHQAAQALVSGHAEQMAALLVEHAARLADLQARHALDSQESLLAVDAKLSALMVERDQQIAELRREFEGRVAHHAQQYAALESQLTEQTADLERQLAFTRQDAAEAAEQADRSLAELLATRDALSEALASAETERDRLAQESVTLSRQVTDLQSQLAERDEQLKRTQAEAHAGAALLGNLQQSIDRLGREGGARPPRALVPAVVAEEPLDTRSRLLVQEMGGMEVGYPLQQRTTIGRTSDNDIAIDTNFISRHHAVVLVSSRHTIIEDLKSTNGIRVNGRRISRQLLHDGDLVTIGKSDFRYSLAPLSETPPAP